ncbi:MULTISPECIES: hypothetical protein [unclassified Streptomyces]|uniref:effector-associated constant component EACC1 n=1 Tax=unclassified Streptomyces TaxID=2593676 RepID=UPI0027E569F4|nr:MULTISPECIES: hypothetical protein [unclassified Streptomyces]
MAVSRNLRWHALIGARMCGRNTLGGLMQVDIRVNGEQSELRSLYRWLTIDDDLRPARIKFAGTSTPGEMGVGLELIQVILDNAWSASSLAVAVAAWRHSRPRPGRVTLRVGGTEVEISGDDEEQVRRLIALCSDESATAPPESPDSTDGHTSA